MAAQNRLPLDALDKLVEASIVDYAREADSARKRLAAIEIELTSKAHQVQNALVGTPTPADLKREARYLRKRLDQCARFLAKMQRDRATATLRAMALRAFYKDPEELRRTVAKVQGRDLPALPPVQPDPPAAQVPSPAPEPHGESDPEPDVVILTSPPPRGLFGRSLFDPRDDEGDW